MTEQFFAKIHKIENEVLVAICDTELSGSKFRHNGVTIRISEYFYGTEDYYESEILSLLTGATQINVMGKRITELLIKEEIIHPDSVLWMELPDGSPVGHAITVGASQ